MKRIPFVAFFSLGLLIVGSIITATTAFAEEPDRPQQCELNGLAGSYYRIDTKDAPLSNTLAQSDFFQDDRRILHSPVDIRLFDLPQTDERRFPDNNVLPGSPQYFAARWNGVVFIPRDGIYRVTLSSHEESQLFINGNEAIAVHSNHEYGGRMVWIHFAAGTSTVEIYFAKRSDFNTGLVFRIDGEGVRFSPCGITAPQSLPVHDNNNNAVPGNIETNAATTTDSALAETSTDGAMRITSTAPSHAITAGSLFIYDVETSGENGETAEFRLVEAPHGMMIVPSTGFIFWRPAVADAQRDPYRFVVSVSDGKQLVYQSVELSVSIPVTNPVLSQTNNIVNNSYNTNTPAAAVQSTALTNASAQESNQVLSHTQKAADAGKRLSATALFTGVFSSLVNIKTQLRSFGFFVLAVLIISALLYGTLEIINTFKLRTRLNSGALRQENAQ